MMDFVMAIIIIVILCYGLSLSIKTKDFLNPIMSFITPIAISYIVFQIFYRKNCSDETIYIYCLGIVFFTFGFVIHRVISRYNLHYSGLTTYQTSRSYIRITRHFEIIFKIITIVSLVLNVIYIFKAAISGPFLTNIIRNIRYYSNYGDGKGFLTEYSMIVVKVFLCVLLYQYFVEGNHKKKIWIVICTVTSIIGIISTIARTQILNLAIIWFYIFTLGKIKKNKKSMFLSWKTIKEKWRIILIIFLLIFSFYYIAIKTNKIGGVGIYDSNFFVNSYLGKELLNFDLYVKDFSSQGKGYYSLGWVAKILESLNIIESPHTMEYIFMRSGGAVESFIKAPYVDFGIYGVCLIMLLIGFFNGFVYKQVLTKSGYWCLFYTTCIYSNIMAFFDYQYMMSGQMYFLLVLLLSGSIKMSLGNKQLT